jgi:acyl carrier protein
MKDINLAVRAYILDNFLMGSSGAELGDEKSFLDHHIIDSTGFIELVMFLETTYGIKIQDEEMIPENLDSIAQITRFVTAKLGA